MGAAVRCLCNSKVENDYFHMVNREYGKCKRLFKCLGFTEKAGRELIKVFYRLDADGSRSVDYDEFAKFFEIDNTPFSKKCFMSNLPSHTPSGTPSRPKNQPKHVFPPKSAVPTEQQI